MALEQGPRWGYAAVIGAALGAAVGGRVHAAQPERPAADVHRIVLGNGATVILQPIPGVRRVAVEAVYRVGYLDEPKGLTQAAHLIEHLACMAATQGYGPGESYKLLNARGMANAETLPDWTHYDMTAPAADLDRILGIEAERLTSLRITPEVVAQEAPRCYAEAAAVEGSPGAPLLKFAVMAAHQGWRHGMTEAQVRGGLAEAAIEDLRRFHGRTYTPANLILTAAGDFEPAEAERLVRERIGAIPAGDAPQRRPIDWAAAPREARMEWDCSRAAVVVGFPPPADPAERIALSLWGTFAARDLGTDAAVAEVAESAACTGHTWPAGRLPFFLYGTVREGGEPGAAAAVLRGFAVSKRGANVTSATKRELLAFLDHSTKPPPLTETMIRAQAKSVAARMPGLDPVDLILGNAALQMATRELLLGSDPEVVARAKAIVETGLQELIRRTLDPERAFTLTLVPKD